MEYFKCYKSQKSCFKMPTSGLSLSKEPLSQIQWSRRGGNKQSPSKLLLPGRKSSLKHVAQSNLKIIKMLMCRDCCLLCWPTLIISFVVIPAVCIHMPPMAFIFWYYALWVKVSSVFIKCLAQFPLKYDWGSLTVIAKGNWKYEQKEA